MVMAQSGAWRVDSGTVTGGTGSDTLLVLAEEVLTTLASWPSWSH